MKHTFIIASALLLGLLLPASASAPSTSTANETYVYICTGKSAKRYHKTKDCKGLNKCKGEIKKVTLAYAESIDKTPCKLCYKKAVKLSDG